MGELKKPCGSASKKLLVAELCASAEAVQSGASKDCAPCEVKKPKDPAAFPGGLAPLNTGAVCSIAAVLGGWRLAAGPTAGLSWLLASVLLLTALADLSC